MTKEKIKNSKNLYKVFPYYKKYKKLWYLEIFTLTILSIFGIIFPILSANFLASLSEFNFTTALYLTIWYGIILMINPMLSHTNAYIYAKIAVRVEKDIRHDLITAITGTQMSTCDQTDNGIFIERINSDVARCSDALLDVFNTLLELISNLAFFIYIAFLNIWFFIILALFVITCYIFDTIKEKRWWKDWKKVKDLKEISTGSYTEQIRALRDIKSLNIKNNTIADSDIKITNTLEASLKARKTRQSLAFYRDILSNLFLLSFFLIGIWFIKSEWVGIATFLIVFSYSTNVKSFSRHLAGIKEYITQGEICAYRVFDIIEKFPKEKFGKDDAPIKIGKLNFQNVSFGYNEESQVLKNINIEFEPNKMTAIVGKSGCGKSTILALANKLYSLKNGNGQITLDDKNINTLTEDSLRNSISTVTQSPYIYNTTIKENMRLIIPNVTDDEIWSALKKVQIYDFVKKLPKKLDAKIGENGVLLSGGQKQRFAIARILLKNPKVIIFDEATSALDNENQEKIVDVVNSLKNNHTIIIVAHRLSTIVDADKIIVLDDGIVAGSGTHSQLMRTCPIYSALYRKEEQAQKFEEKILTLSEELKNE